ncbi:MAG TPA: hypothetical protein PKH51_01790 [Candidatus Sumerlaeota bacterium]|nr:hypothetical protein [Candidatus Sumerlaeota bacterium]HNM45726.1 hypothetical protein [Candidatus Sumerlaeota bacterium]
MRSDLNHSPITGHHHEDHGGHSDTPRRHAQFWNSVLYYVLAICVGLGVLFILNSSP